MDIFESLEELNVSEECFEDILNIVEDLLSEDRLIDDNGRRTDAFYELRDNMTAKLKDQKATASALRKQELKKAKRAKQEADKIEKEELPKADHNLQIASGDRMNTAARYHHDLNQHGRHNPVSKRSLESAKYFRKKHKEALKNRGNVVNRMLDKDAESYEHGQKASNLKVKASDLADKITRVNR